MKRYLALIAITFGLCGTSVVAQDFTLNAPDTVTGNTCGAVDDCSLSPSEDHIYQVVIPCGGDWRFSLCNSSYNTSMFLTSGICGGSTIASNDDACGLMSEMVVTLSAGTYFLAVEGSTAPDCGAYTLEVSDAQDPVISNCQSDVTINNDPNACGAVYNYSIPTAADNCGIASFVGSHTSGQTFPVGTTTVEYVAIDNAGNTDTCSFDITVVDVQLPVFTNCPNNILVVNDPGECGAVVSWNAPIVTDNCGVNTVTSTHSPGSTFPVGVTNVVYTATDDNGNSSTCTFSVTVLDDESPVVTCPGNITVNNDTGDCGAIVNYTVTGSDNCPGYTLSLTAGLASGSFFPVGTTTQTYTITDTSGNSSTCSFNVTVVDNEPPVFSCPPPMLICGDSSSVTFTAPVVNDNCSGVVVSQTGGPSSGSTFPVGTTTITYSALDNAGNPATCSFDIIVYNNPTADFSYSPACAGEAILFDENSTIPVDSVTGFAWNMGDGSGIITIRNPVYQFSDTGMYNVVLTVTSDQNCSSSDTQMVHVTPVPVADFTTANACLSDTVDFTDASSIDAGNLNYLWNFGDNSTSIDQNPGHIYSNPGTFDVMLTVTSDEGCDDDVVYSVTVYSNPSASYNSQNILCHGDSTGWLNVLAGNGIPPYEFSIDSGMTTQNNGVFNDLAAGVYDVLVTDFNSCSAVIPITINEPDTLVLGTDSVQHILCNGDMTGAITLGVNGGASPYLYSLDGSPWQNSPIFGSLTANSYELEVLDNNGCSDTIGITLNEPLALVGQVSQQVDVLCNGYETGSLVLNGSGGVAPYDYSIDGGDNFQSSQTFMNLGAGEYNLVVRDTNGCWTMWNTSITQPSALVIDPSVQGELCFGDTNGSIQVIASGSVGGYQYSINGGQSYQVSNTFIDLAAGQYIVSVIDGNQCTTSEGVTVSGPSASLSTVAGNIQDVLCLGDSNGVLTLATSGGTEVYEYSIDGGANWQLSQVFDSLATGNYIVRTRDHNGCLDTDTFFVNEPASLPNIALIVTEDVECYGTNAGSISLQAAGGTPGYTYSINGGNSFQSSSNFNSLSGGTYHVQLKDNNGCLAYDTLEVMEPDTSLWVQHIGSTQPFCEGDTTGAFSIDVSGGTSPYMLDIGEGPQNGGVFSGLMSGMHTVIITDSNDCELVYQYTLEADNPLPDAAFSYQVAGSSVAFTNQSTDGLVYSWDFGDTTNSDLESPTHQYDSPGEYTVTLIVTNGCGSDTLVYEISTYNTGLALAGGDEFKVYPNPSEGLFTVELGDVFMANNETVELRIFSIEGKMVEGRILNNKTQMVDFENIGSGVYTIELSTGTDRLHRKLIIK